MYIFPPFLSLFFNKKNDRYVEKFEVSNKTIPSYRMSTQWIKLKTVFINTPRINAVAFERSFSLSLLFPFRKKEWRK